MVNFIDKVQGFLNDYGQPIGRIVDLVGQYQSAGNAQEGYKMQVKGYKQAAKQVLAAQSFNSGVARLNTLRQQEAIRRQGDRLLSNQVVNVAASGFNPGSKSFLMVMNEGLDIVNRKISDARTDAFYKEKADMFEAQTQVYNLNVQAQQAKYQAKLAKAEGPNLMSTLSSVASIVGQLGGIK